MKEKLELYISKNLETETYISFSKAKFAVDRACCTSYAPLEDLEKEARFYSSKVGVDDFIDKNKSENEFQKLLFKYIDDRNLKDSDVYNKVHIDRRLFSKIRSDSEYHPSKDTVILLGLSLELSEKEMDDLLLSASYSLPKNNVYDLIIRFCFVEGIYKVTDVNELLDSHQCKLFLY